MRDLSTTGVDPMPLIRDLSTTGAPAGAWYVLWERGRKSLTNQEEEVALVIRIGAIDGNVRPRISAR